MAERGSILIFTFRGIPVRIHWSFGLLLLWVWYTGTRYGMDWPAIGVLGLLILSLFACVVLHEFGHALTAKRYGIATRDIILSPIGGVARLNKIPEKPAQELLVALAGPAVNVVIATLLGVIAWLFLPRGLAIQGESETAVFWIGNFVPLLFWMNLYLVLFNMIPAFPMDGGRVLRSLLALRMGRLKATTYAAGIGRGLAILFMVIAIWQEELFLGLIGLFVYFMATQELKMVKSEHLYRQFTAGQVTRRQMTRLTDDTLISDAILMLQHSLETHFPLDEGNGQITQYVRAHDLLKANASGHGGLSVTYVAKPISGVVRWDVALPDLFAFFQRDPHALLIVLRDDGSIYGVLDRDQIDHVLYWSQRHGGFQSV
jgi:Zn-dependent protease